MTVESNVMSSSMESKTAEPELTLTGSVKFVSTVWVTTERPVALPKSMSPKEGSRLQNTVTFCTTSEPIAATEMLAGERREFPLRVATPVDESTVRADIGEPENVTKFGSV